MVAPTQRRFGGALFMPMLVMIWQRLSAQTPGGCSPGYCTAGNAANGYATLLRERQGDQAFKNIEIPDAIKELEFTGFKFDVP